MLRMLKTLILSLALVPVIASASHITVNAAYCATEPGKGRVVAIQTLVSDEVAFEWTYDPTASPKENQKDLAALMDKHIKDETENWKRHPIKVQRVIVGECPERSRL